MEALLHLPAPAAACGAPSASGLSEAGAPAVAWHAGTFCHCTKRPPWVRIGRAFTWREGPAFVRIL